MNIVIDLILVAIVIAIVIISAKKGILITVLEVVAFVLAIYLASLASAPVASGMYTAFFEKTVENKLYDVIPEDPSALTYTQKAEKAIQGIPDFAKNYAEKVGIDVNSISEKIAQSNMPNNDKLYLTINEQIVKPIAIAVLKNVMFFVLAIIFGLLLKLVAKGINSTAKKSDGISSLNSIIGGVLGIVKGLVVVIFVSFILTYMAPKVDNPKFTEGVEKSAIIQLADKFDPMEAISAAGVFASNVSNK